MAFIQCDFFSDVLGMSSSMNVIIPENRENRIGVKTRADQDKYPVLYLLHGLSDDHTVWMRRTSIERYANKFGLAVIMPNVHRSFYTDMVYGSDYFTFMSKELPQIAEKLFPLHTERKNTFAAGLSMGGYGAFKLALNQPERFAAAASLSGALNLAENAERVDERDELYQEFKLIFGDLDKVKNTDNDLFYLLKKLKGEKKKIPKLYQCCGTEDFLYQDNLKFRAFCRKNKVKLKYEEESAVHEWSYWDKKIQAVLKWLPL
ncbi:S-formylglutathione hydrolase FrmB [Halanaerobium saccharolyticum]|uniref:S-formylglutathione hydrolase FrmB n=1 Tax=Halanaerobium saccharolyticum TaxID=43595 RepID=A0A4R6LEL3_9FIRM|nr:alpha/beta hydrolase family protein [Halanaerobium saccharolyticum]TDO73350.1 S-formylglutathione hydrolase FrmB [Halanaerobium saccharolyticum]